MRFLLCTTLLYSTAYAGLDDVSSQQTRDLNITAGAMVVQTPGSETKTSRFKKLSTHLVERKAVGELSVLFYKGVISFVEGMTSAPSGLRAGSFFKDSKMKLSGKVSPFLSPWHALMYMGLNLPIVQSLEQPRQVQKGRRPIISSRFSDIDYMPHILSLETLSKLVVEHQKHKDLYHKGCPQITNFAYDLLLRKIETVYNHISESSTKQINSSVWQKSYEEIYSVHELAAYFMKTQERYGKNKDREYLFYPEINGVDCILTYENGILTQSVAVFNSENIDISNISASNNRIPKSISATQKTIVHGKLYLQRRDLNNLNISRNKQGFRSWIDTRSAITKSILSSIDPNKELDLGLRFVFFSLHQEGQESHRSSVKKRQDSLTSMGFPVLDTSCYILGTAKQALGISETLINQPFECIGVRVKPIDSTQDTVSCIFKQTPDIFKSKVKSIIFRPLANGYIVSIVNITPVSINGKIVDKFVINNSTEYDELDLRENDDVELMLTGTKQPFIYRSLYTSNKEKIPYPSDCPKCNAPLKVIQIDRDQVSICPAHLSCRDESYSHIVHYASAGGANINTLSKSILLELKKKLLVTGVEDLYRLTMNDFELLGDIKPEEYRQLLRDIEISKQITLSRFIYALNIPGITTIIAEELSYLSGTLERFLCLKTKDLTGSHLLNDSVKKPLTEYLNNSSQIESVKKLLAVGVVVNGIDPEIANLCGLKENEYNKETYDKLSKMIEACNASYEVTDYEYDRLLEIKKKVELAKPQWKLSESSKSDGKKIPWKDIIFLQKTYSSAELDGMEPNSGDSLYLIEPKVNGVACSLFYEAGKLKRALTKGNSHEAMDITTYVTTKVNIPKLLKTPFSGVVRGELYITMSNLNKINEERMQSGYAPYVDGLSLIVGSLNARQNSTLINSFAQFFPFRTISEQTSPYLIETSVNPIVMHQNLTKLGFDNVMSDKMFVRPWKEAIKIAADFESMRLMYAFDIDGVIIRPVENHTDSKIYALKYNQEIKKSKLESVEFYTLQNKHLVALLRIAPIRFSNGRVVSKVRVFPQNFEKLYINQTISVKYSGGAVPVLVKGHKQLHADKNTEVKIPLNCPTCNGLLEKKLSGGLLCTNQRCSPQSLQKPILDFAGKMNIISNQVDRELLVALINKGIVRRVGDLYTLFFEDISQTVPLPLKTIREFEHKVKRTQHISLLSFIKALGIQVKFDTPEESITTEKVFGLTMETLIAQNVTPHKAKNTIEAIQKYKQDIETFGFFLEENLKLFDSKEKNSTKKQDIRSIESSLKSRNISIISALQQCADLIDRVIELNEKDLWWLSLNTDDASHKKLSHYLKSAQRLDRNELRTIRHISDKYVKIAGAMSPYASQQKPHFADRALFDDCSTSWELD